MRASFVAVNLKGMEGLFRLLLRCCYEGLTRQ